MNTNWIIDTFDFYGYEAKINIFGKKSYKTIWGGIFGILTLISIATISMFFIVELLSRKSLSLIFNKNTNIATNISIANDPLFVYVIDNNGIIHNDDRLWPLSVVYYDYVVDKGITALPVSHKKCDENYMPKNKDFLSPLQIYKYSRCLDVNSTNVQLFGKFGDADRGYSILTIY